MVCLKLLSHLLGKTEEKHEKPQRKSVILFYVKHRYEFINSRLPRIIVHLDTEAILWF
jgi:hypothetical protein